MLRSPASMVRVVPIPENLESRTLLSVAAGAMTPLTTADFNADGVAESVVWVGARRTRSAGLGVGGTGLRRGSLAILDGSGLLLDSLSIRARGNLAPLTAAADFNEDGNLDLVVASRRLTGVRSGLAFLAGNGDGTFATAVPIGNAPANVTSLAARDVDGDGHADLVGTARASNRQGNTTGNTTGGILPLVLDEASRGEKLWTIIDGDNTTPGNPDREHLVGAGAEAGGGVLDGSAALPPEAAFAGGGDFLFGGFTFDLPVSVAPGFVPPAARVGATAEAGGARVGGFDDLLFPQQTFVLFGNGDGTFDSTGSTPTTGD